MDATAESRAGSRGESDASRTVAWLGHEMRLDTMTEMAMEGSDRLVPGQVWAGRAKEQKSKRDKAADAGIDVVGSRRCRRAARGERRMQRQRRRLGVRRRKGELD